jgi:hypothetical protein
MRDAESSPYRGLGGTVSVRLHVLVENLLSTVHVARSWILRNGLKPGDLCF